MHRLFNSLKPLLVVAAAALMAHCHAGCKDVSSPDPNLAYTLEIAKCVNEAKTLEESHQCRAKVNWMYGLCPDPTGELLCQ